MGEYVRNRDAGKAMIRCLSIALPQKWVAFAFREPELTASQNDLTDNYKFLITQFKAKSPLS